MPAEWEKHEATWLSWPKNPLTFPESMLPAVEKAYCDIVKALSPGEKVKILVDNPEMEEKVLKKLINADASMGNVRFLKIKSADVWIRDYGPTFLLNRKTQQKAVVKWIFNAWGNKYDDLLYDNEAGEQVVKTESIPVFRPGIVLEGGSIDVNGAGCVLTTEQCLLNKNRNPQLSREQIEGYLRGYLGVEKTIWLKSGIEGDDTDGHIDDFARFISRRSVLCAFEEGNDNNSLVLKKNLEILEKTGFEITKLPMPKPLIDPEEGRRLPASYANFYLGNKVVLLPSFGEERDKEAASILRGFFPGRETVSINSRELVYGYGGLHCITQQEPKAK